VKKIFESRKSVIIITEGPISPALQKLAETVVDLAIVSGDRIEEIFQLLEQQQYPVDIVMIEAAEITDGKIRVSNNSEELIEKIKLILSIPVIHLIGLLNSQEEHDYSAPPGFRCCYGEDGLSYLLQEMRVIGNFD